MNGALLKGWSIIGVLWGELQVHTKMAATRPRRFGKTLNLSMIECFFFTRYKNRADIGTKY